MKSKFIGMLCLGFALADSTGRATLISDSTDLTRYFPNDSAAYEIYSGILVQKGSSDTVNSISNDFCATDFVTGITASGNDDTIVNVLVNSSLGGWTNDRLSFEPHSLSSNWQYLTFTTDRYLNLQLATTPAQGSEGWLTLGLLAVALAVLAGIGWKQIDRRRKRARVR